MLSARFSTFTSTKRPFVTSGSRPQAGIQQRPVRGGLIRRIALDPRTELPVQHCPNYGAGELKLIAAIVERSVIEEIPTHLGLDPQPPPKGRAREARHDFAA